MITTRLRQAYLAGSALLALGLAATAAPLYRTGPEPEWVVRRDGYLEAKTSLGLDTAGFYYLLADEQVNVSLNQYYTHYAFKVASSAGLKNATQITFSFDPSWTRMVLHHLRIVRNGSSIDLLGSAPVRLIEQEQDLERHFYDGRKTLVIFLQSIRVGDIVDYAVSEIGDNPIFAGRFSYSFDLQFDDPVVRSYSRVTLPAGRSISWRSFGGAPSPDRRDTAGCTVYEWRATDATAIFYEDGAPEWFVPCPVVELSEWNGWGAVAAWAQREYPFDPLAGLCAAPEIGAIIAAAGGDSAQTARLLLRYVQDQIRYLGIEMGVYSHRPRSPVVTLKNRFGDCKDKAYLLCALLRECGITASPVLVSTNRRDSIASHLPSPAVFNHVIAAIDIGGRRYWVDPTIDHQGGTLANTYLPDYGAGLVLNGKDTALSVIPNGALRCRSLLAEEYFADNPAGPVELVVHSEYRGDDADDMRAYFRENSREAIGREYVNYFARLYPGVESRGQPVFSDDPDSNVVRVAEYYRIADFWKVDTIRGERTAGFSFHSMGDVLKKPDIRKRRHPVELAYPYHHVQTTVAHLPRTFGGESSADSENSPYLAFSFQSRHAGSDLRLSWDLATRQDAVNANDIGRFCESVDRIDSRSAYSISENLTRLRLAAMINRSPYLVGLAMLALLAAIGFVIWLVQRTAANRQPVQSPPALVYVTKKKLVILYCCTVGLYGIWWFYRNWQLCTRAAGAKGSPALRALLAVVFCFPLFGHLRNAARDRGVPVAWRPWQMTVLFIGTSILALVPGAGFLLFMLSSVPLAIVQETVNRAMAAALPGTRPDGRFSVLAVYSAVTGGLLVVMAAIATIVGV